MDGEDNISDIINELSISDRMEIFCLTEEPVPYYSVYDVPNIDEISVFGKFGWMDVCVIRAEMLNRGGEYFVVQLNGLEMLDDFAEVKFVIGYTTETGAALDGYIPDLSSSDPVSPIYMTLRGWLSDTTNLNSWDDLPDLAKEFLEMVESYIGAPIRALNIKNKIIYK